MIKIVGNDIWRGGQKIGYIQNDDIYDHRGQKIGYFTTSSGDIHSKGGKKIGYVEGEYVRTVGGESMRLSDNRRVVQGGAISDLARAAVRFLLGA